MSGAGGESIPRRMTAPTFERGHTGLTPPGKRQCLDNKDGEMAELEMGPRLSWDSVASDCTILSDYGVPTANSVEMRERQLPATEPRQDGGA